VLDYNKKLGDIRELLAESVSEAWDSENDLLSINLEPFDTAHILTLAKTDNNQLNKIITVFSVLISEVKKLHQIAEEKYYGPLAMFGHVIEVPQEEDSSKPNPGADQQNGGAAGTSGQDASAYAEPKLPLEVQMGKFLPFMQDLSNFTRRINNVVRNFIAQLACLYHERMKIYATTFKMVELDLVFDAIGEALTILITIDSLIAENEELRDAWAAYRRMFRYVRADPASYGVTAKKAKQLEVLLTQLDERLMSVTSFACALQQDYSLPDPRNPYAPPPPPNAPSSAQQLVASNRAFTQAFTDAISRGIQRAQAGFKLTTEVYERTKIVELFALYSLYRTLFRTTVKFDSKVFQTLWEMQLKVPIVALDRRASWFPADFLMKYAEPPANISLKPAPKDVVKARKEFLNTLDENFQAETQSLYMNLSVWMVRMESELVAAKEHSTGAILNARAKFLLYGLLIAQRIRNLLSISIHLRLQLRAPFQSRNLRSAALCLEMLKAVEHTFKRRLAMISDNVVHMIAQTQFALRKTLAPIKELLEQRDRLNDTKADVYAATCLAFKMLQETPTPARRTVLKLAISVMQTKLVLQPEQQEEVRYQLWKLNMLSEYQQNLARATNASVIYWASNLVPEFLADAVRNPTQCHRLPYIFAALRDCASMLASSTQLTDPARAQRLHAAYVAEVKAHVRNVLVLPIARQIETDLRLHIHSVLLNQESLRSTTQERTDLQNCLTLKPIRLFDEIFDLKEQVTNYLDATFYNHNTVALHNSRTYAEMRNLAKEKFNLQLAEMHLPGSSHYSEALDVLEIMRNIHIFVARFNYNMNTQIFVERAIDQKHVNVIDVDHISNSIRTHGMGIMNTTVNYTYQFLCRKFSLVYEFLFDDHIMSPLQRDVHQFRQNKKGWNNQYPYTMAERFIKDIRKKLGATASGLTFIDHFRNLITEIGNALGYVRMVRSGGLHHASSAVKFIPDLTNIIEFEPLCQESGLSQGTIEAAKNLDMALSDLATNVAEGTEYFQLLVRVFRQVFDSEEHQHLKNFFVIVPALTINFVEVMMQKKERLHKRMDKTEAGFTDDGFALGIAYILRLLEQDADFDSLHWFESVQAHLRRQRAQLEQTMAANKGKSSGGFDAAHTQVAIKRLEAVIVEYDLLQYSLTGARVFFRDESDDIGSKDADAAAVAAAGAGASSVPGVDSSSTSTTTTSGSTTMGPTPRPESLTDIQTPNVDYGSL